MGFMWYTSSMPGEDLGAIDHDIDDTASKGTWNKWFHDHDDGWGLVMKTTLMTNHLQYKRNFLPLYL